MQKPTRRKVLFESRQRAAAPATVGNKRALNPQYGAPDTIRTCDLCLRSNLTCPTPKDARATDVSLSHYNCWKIWNSAPQIVFCDTPRFPSNCLRGAYAGDGLRTGEIPWLSSPSALSRPPGRKAGTMSSGTTNCPGLACASSCRVSAATSFSTALPDARVATPSVFMAYGRQSSPERKPGSSWVGW